MKDNKEIIEILIEHIEKLYDLDGSEIKYSKLEVKEEKRKYSSAKTKILYVDGTPLSGKQMKHCKLDWKCRCGRINNILLIKYLNKSNYWCQHCNQDSKFSDRLFQNVKGKIKKNKNLPKNLRIPFNMMDNDFLSNYYSIHISSEMFNKYLPFMYSLNDVILTPEIISTIKYEFALPTNNQKRFCPKISFDGKIWKSIHKIQFKCKTCGKIFNIHKENLKNIDLQNIECTGCKLCNHTYKIKLYKNTSLTYQSNLEYQFIEFCTKHNIKIENGFEIQYNFKNKNHTYISDFILPELKMIVELKGTNRFYLNDLKSGKIDAKNNAAKLFALDNNYTFQFVLDKDINDFYSFILKERDGLNNSEIELKIG